MVYETKNEMTTTRSSMAVHQATRDQARANVAASITDGLSSVEKLCETMIAWAQQTLGGDEFVAAKEEFFTQTGKFFSDDPFYDERITYFLDHFIFGRPVARKDGDSTLLETPYQSFMRSSQLYEGGSQAEKFADFAEIGCFRHSLFQVLRCSKNEMLVRDLVSGTKHKISAQGRTSLVAFHKHDLFQGYLLPYRDQVYLSLGVIHHPSIVSRLVRGELKKLLKAAEKGGVFDKGKFLFDLAHRHMRAMRHKKADPRLLYKVAAPK